ncbi:rho GTPase-activating protein 45, partial [Tachysurus ichikawai]
EQPRRDPDDGTSMLAVPDLAVLSSCPGTPSTIHGKLVASSNANLKRSTGLSRHASAAGFPFHTAGTWGFSRTQTKCSESTEGTVIDVEDIPPLLRDVARFAEAVEKLKDVVLCEGGALGL